MPLTEDDVARLEALGHEREAFSFVSPEDGVVYLRTVEPVEGMPGRPCFFLKDDRCSVYADRPQGCRIYPFVLTEDGRLARDEDCPFRQEFAHDAGARRRLQRVVGQLAAEARRRARGASEPPEGSGGG